MAKTSQRRPPSCLLGCAALLALMGCTSADSTAYTAAPVTPTATDPLAAVRALIGDAACSSDAQCATVAVGAKACGGPEAYLAWSSQRSDGKALESAASAYTARRTEAAAGGGRMSNCAVTVDPGAWCAPAGSGRSCQLRPAGGGSAR